jgi:imidazolonepropionase-like amidohydrolase
MKTWLLAAFLTLAVMQAQLSAETYVIRNATIMTVSKGTLKGSIVVKDGKISEVGEKVMEPSGAKIIDAAGQY